MTTLATLVVRITADTTDYATKLKAVSEIGKKISDVGGKLTKAVTLPLVAIGAFSVKAAADLADMRGKVETIFGESSKLVEDFGKTAATNFGLSNRAADEATSTFGAMFTNLGLGTGAAAKMSIGMVGLAGDMAEFRNASPEEMLSSLQGALTGRGMDLKKFGLDLSDAALQAKALEMGIGGVGGKLSETEAVQVRYALIMEQTAKIQGTYKGSLKELGPMLQTLKASTENAAAAIGTKLLPHAIKIVDWITRMVVAFTNLPAPVQNTVITIAALAAATGPVLTIFGKLMTAGAGVVGFFKTLPALLASSTAVLGPLAIGLAVVAGALIIYNTLNKQTKEGVKQVQTAWSGFFDSQIEGGKSAIEIAAAYNQKTTEANKIFNGQKNVLDKVAVAWIKLTTDESKFLGDTAGLHQALMLTSKSADEYWKASVRASGGSEKFANSSNWMIKALRDQALAEWNATNGIPPLVDEEGKLTAVGIALTDSMTKVESAINAMNLPVEDAANKINDLKIAVGMLTPEQEKLNSDTDLMAEGYAAGAISLDRMTAFLKDAVLGTSDMTDAERAQLTALTAVNEEMKKTEALLKSQVDFALSGQIKKSYENYTQGMEDVEKKSAELEEKMRKLGATEFLPAQDIEAITRYQSKLTGLWISVDDLIKKRKEHEAFSDEEQTTWDATMNKIGALQNKITGLGGVPYLSADQRQELEDLRQQWAGLGDEQDQLAKALQEATNQMIFQRAAEGLNAEATLALGRALGVISEEDFAVATVLDGLNKATANTNPLGYAADVKAVADAVNSLQSKDIEVTVATIGQEMGVTTPQAADALGQQTAAAFDIVAWEIAGNSAATKLADGMTSSTPGLEASATTSAQNTMNAFTVANWEGAGISAGGKIAAGITSSTPAIVNAATGAVQAALNAAAAAVAANAPTTTTPPPYTPGYAEGGSGVVPPGYSNDSYLIGLTSGEMFTVTPPGAGSGETVINVPITIYGNADPEKVKAAARDGVLAAQRAAGKR